jgi:hypothetical protein
MKELLMRSPFPGMDPFLEAPDIWPDVHTRLIVGMSDVLAEKLSPHFIVAVEQRLIVSEEETSPVGAIIPDLAVVTPARPGVTAPLDAGYTAPTLIEPLPEPEVRERFIEIRDARTRRVVTIIELLSPANKTPGAPSATAFERKRTVVFESRTNWIEIDLLRAGARFTATAGKSDYCVLLKRATDYRYEAWFIDLRDRLPVILVPTTREFGAVTLNLQQVFETAYARARYGDWVDYTAPVPPRRCRQQTPPGAGAGAALDGGERSETGGWAGLKGQFDRHRFSGAAADDVALDRTVPPRNRPLTGAVQVTADDMAHFGLVEHQSPQRKISHIGAHQTPEVAFRAAWHRRLDDRHVGHNQDL